MEAYIMKKHPMISTLIVRPLVALYYSCFALVVQIANTTRGCNIT